MNRPRRPPSLEWRLPLLMSGVLAVVLGAALALTYATLAREALAAHQERLDRGVQQLAAYVTGTVRQGRGRLAAIADDPAVRAALRTPTPAAAAAAREALARLATPADSGLPNELWTADGRRLALAGTDVPFGGARAPLPPRRGLRPPQAGDSVVFGQLYERDGRAHFWLLIPVRAGDTTLGYVLRQRRIVSGPQAEALIRQLSGDSVAYFYRNDDGSAWATLSGVPERARHPASAGRWLVAAAHIGGTPFSIAGELPRGGVLAAPRRAMLTLAGLAVALLGAGVVISLGISRRLTRPLVSLTEAAEAIARGDYDARVVVQGGHDEVARLAASFNHMVGEVAASRAALQASAAEARGAADALSRSNAELRAAREAADAASRAKSDFLAVMSHELRTPLNAIGGYTELMSMELRGPITPEQRRDLERIRVSQQHLLGLVSAVLDMSRIERGQLEYDVTTVALDPFLAGLDALVGPQAQGKALRLTHVPCGDDVAVVADREKLRQIVLNLLSNAIRYTPAGGHITLEAAPRDDRVELRVRDTGIGIAPEKQAQIFEPFVQLDRSLTRPQEGVGLGLAISRELARGMGGELSVESAPGAGACFVLALPRGVLAPGTPFYLTGEMQAVVGRR